MAGASTIDGDGVRLHVREWPAPGPSALLLHGLASTSHIWDLVAPRLERAGIRAVAYDQRGHGRSSKPASGYGFEQMATDATSLIRTLRLGRPFVVGHSWGANVALELAVRHPRSIRGLVLVDGGFLSMRERFDWPTAKRVLAPPDIDGMPVKDFLRAVRRELRSAMEVTPEIEAHVLSSVRVDRAGGIHPRLSRAHHRRILRAMWEQDAPALLGRVRVPTLVIAARPEAGSADPSGFQAAKARAARTVRGIGRPVRFEWMDGVHDLPLQRPEALARRIVRAARP